MTNKDDGTWVEPEINRETKKNIMFEAEFRELDLVNEISITANSKKRPSIPIHTSLRSRSTNWDLLCGVGGSMMMTMVR